LLYVPTGIYKTTLVCFRWEGSEVDWNGTEPLL